MTVEDQAGGAVIQAQKAWMALSESWVQNVEQVWRRTPALPPEMFDANQPLDLVFHLTGRLLEANHHYARSLAEASSTLGGAVRDYVESIGDLIRDQAAGMKQGESEVVHEAERQVARQAQRGAAERYDRLVKAELQDKLAERNLPMTGNVEELRQRLIEEDLKASA